MSSRKGAVASIRAQGLEVALYKPSKEFDYVSLTDIARYRSTAPKTTIQNWIRNRDVIEYLGLWETLYNPDFKGIEFEALKQLAGRNAFVLTPKQWIERTGAIGMVSRSGRSGGTFAHTDIAFEFASWVSPEFKLYLITDYQRLKLEEQNRTTLAWDVTRELSKINYRIHIDAIRSNLIPAAVTAEQRKEAYSSEADVLNVALFGCTASEWKRDNPGLSGNMRDYANIYQLIVLSNIESYNAELIKQGMDQRERLNALNKAAREQIGLLVRSEAALQLLEKETGRPALPESDNTEP